MARSHSCARRRIHFAGARGGSGGRAASAPQLNDSHLARGGGALFRATVPAMVPVRRIGVAAEVAEPVGARPRAREQTLVGDLRRVLVQEEGDVLVPRG